MTYRGTSLIRNSCPPSDQHRALGIVSRVCVCGCVCVCVCVCVCDESVQG